MVQRMKMILKVSKKSSFISGWRGVGCSRYVAGAMIGISPKRVFLQGPQLDNVLGLPQAHHSVFL